jgi:hypothetical protein
MATTPNSVITPQTPVVVVGQTIATANTAKDGTGTVVTAYTAGANGSKVDGVYVAYTGTSVATVLRLFINNGSVTTTATNNALLKSVTVPANTLSEVAAANDFFVPLALTLPAGYKITATIGTTVAAALALFATGGDL